jgi:transglutaminase-like putative cysteine protease
MRFSAIHKLASYLMVAFSFAALALSEELSPWAVLLGGLGVLGSWFWEAPRVRVERWSAPLSALALAAFGYTVLNALSTGEWLTSGAHLLVFLLVAKLMSRRSSRDYQWVYVLTFLMLVAGTTLNVEISYALCFLGYVVTATWAMILFHLRREMEENFLLKHSDDSSSERVEVERILSSRRIVGPGFLAATAAVSLVVFFLSIVLFFLFPRIGLGLFMQKSRARLTFAGFSDGVTLGGHGVIRNDDTIVMRIKVSDPRYEGPRAPELHWRGVAFDRYADGRWSRSPTAYGTRAAREHRHGVARLRLDAAAGFGDLEREALRQEIYLEPLDTATLFAAATPAAFDLDDVILGSPAAVTGRLGQNDEIRYTHAGGLRYVAWSDPRGPGAAALRASPAIAGAAYAPYLALPDDLPPRVIDLATKIVEGKTTAYDKAEAIAAYLRRNYRYTLVLDSDDRREPLDYFLFERRQGHCEYFSSAMAVMLRAVGVPSRNVNGFLGGEWNEYGKYIAVRSGDAHSWVEAYFEGIGWVTFDPTPAAAALGRGASVWDKLRRLVDNLRLSWFRWVVEYDLGRQIGLFRGLGDALGLGKGGFFRSGQFTRWLAARKLPLAGAMFLLAAAVGAWRYLRARRKAAGATDAQGRGPEHPVVTLYTTAARALARRGHVRPPAATPREFAETLVARAAPGAKPFVGLTDLYYAARYARAPVDLMEARRLVDEVKLAAKRKPARLTAPDRGQIPR